MAVSLSNIPRKTNVYRFITSGKPGNCSFCREFKEKLEAHHTCYAPEKTIKLCHPCHHRVHFWPNRLSTEEKLQLLKTRFHHQTGLKLLKIHKNNIEEISKLIAPSRSRFVRKAQKLEIKRVKKLKRGEHNKLFKGKFPNKNMVVLGSRMRREKKRVM